MAIHVIRLRGGWDVSTRDGAVCHVRRFGRPANLDATERAWLTCTHAPGPARLLLNGELLVQTSGAGPIAVDLTESLTARNAIEFIADSHEPLGEVTLEIRPA